MVGRMTLVSVVAAVAVAPAVAWGGGFATVGVAPPPEGTGPGKPWNAELTILQHGRTPLEGVKPSVIIRPAGGGAARTFPAKPSGKPGEYVARVVFPAAGRWTYVVDDGFTQRHDFAPVTIGGGAPAPASLPATPAGDEGGGADVWRALGLAAAAGMLAGVATLFVRRRRASGPTVTAGG